MALTHSICNTELIDTGSKRYSLVRFRLFRLHLVYQIQVYAKKVGIIHESNGQHIGKAPSLHLSAGAMLLEHISLVLS